MVINADAIVRTTRVSGKTSDIISTSGFVAAILNTDISQRRQYHY